MEKVQLTAKMGEALRVLQGATEPLFASDIAVTNSELFDKGDKSVNPLLVHLVKNGYAEKVGKGPKEVVDKDGNTVTREYTKYQATEIGRTLDFELKAA